MLSFEGAKTQGAQAITQKLQSLPFQACKHHVSSLDTQISPSGGMNIVVTGKLQARRTHTQAGAVPRLCQALA